MILIFSERCDLLTRKVLAYIYDRKEQFEVFWENDTIEFNYYLESGLSSFSIFKNGKPLCSDKEVKSVWFRRTDIRVESIGINLIQSEEVEYENTHTAMRIEQIRSCLHSKKCLGVFGEGNYNKLKFLEACIALKLNIPKTLVTTAKSDLESFYKRCKKDVITKSLAFPYGYVFEENDYIASRKMGFTVLLNDKHFSKIPESFPLTLFQEKLNKKFELRIFYINGKSFAEAIFSQSVNEAKIDFRQGYHLGMRCCHFELPADLKVQIDSLMKYIGHNTGSIDVVVTEDDKYVFLEVNPNGQFGAISEITNQNYEYEIANFLTN